MCFFFNIYNNKFQEQLKIRTYYYHIQNLLLNLGLNNSQLTSILLFKIQPQYFNFDAAEQATLKL